MSTFTWTPDEGASPDKTPRLRVAAFGEGYEQASPDGVNSIMPHWSLSFSGRSFAEIRSIDAFLEAQGGYVTFDWIPPGESVTKKFRCKTWKPVWNSNHASLTATFAMVPA